MAHRLSEWKWGAWACAVGAVWGLGLAHCLALDGLLPFFLGVEGTALASLLSGAASLFAWQMGVRRGTSRREAALFLTPLALPLADLLLGAYQPWRGPVLLLGGLVALVLAGLGQRLPGWFSFLLLVGLSLGIYLPDVAPWVGRADTFEFQVVAPRLGIAHPSGYPLYILLGKLFSLLPVGSVAWRVNLSSAVCAALAVWFLFLALREWTASPALSMWAALTIAFSPTLWGRAVEAEVYGLNALLVALSLWVAARWAIGGWRAERALPLLGLLAGAGLASHLTLGGLVLLVIPLALSACPRPSLRALALAAGLFVAGVALYLYIPLRWPAVNDGEIMTLSHFLSFVSNAESGGALRPLAFVQDLPRWGTVLRLLRMQVGWAGLLLAALGVGISFRRNRWLALGLALAWLAWVWFALSFYVAEPDYSAFLIPAHVVLGLWLGVGLGWLMGFLQRRAASLVPVVLAAAVLLPLSRLWLTGPLLDTSREQADEAWGRAVMSLPMAPGAAILADSEKFPPLYYLQQIEGVRPDLDLVMRFHEAEYREELDARLGAGQTVYMARYLPHLETYFLRSLGPLVEVGVEPLGEPPAGATPVGVVFGEQVELLAFDWQAGSVEGASYRLILYWRAAGRSQDLEVRLRWVDEAAQVVWVSGGSRPVSGQYPVPAWPEGAVVVDDHEVLPPPWLPQGTYGLQVGLFPLFGQTGLAAEDGTQWVPLREVSFSSNSSLSPLPREVRAAFSNGAWLLGYDLGSEAQAGAPFPVDLGWRGVAAGGRVRLAWVDGSGEELSAEEFPLAASMARSRHVLVAPGAGSAALRVSLVGENVRCGWLAPLADGCSLARVEVLPAQEGLANFAGQLLLLDARMDRASARPGERIAVTLRWRALRVMDEDYTVFVQLVGPDGRLHGQVDTWPAQGTRPTSGWAPGEELDDLYEVALDGDAPAGRYRVQVGWYLLATMQRLQIVDANLQPVGDAFVLGELSVGE